MAVEIVYATGAIEPVKWAKVTTLVRERIVEVCDCEGDTVKTGHVLARLDEREAQARLRELQVRRDFAQSEVDRLKGLVARGAATSLSYDRAVADLRQVDALMTAQAQLTANRLITAPLDGVVLRQDAQVGEVAETGQTLFRVGQPKPLQLVSEVNEEDIPRVKVGQVVLLRADAFQGQRIEGKVNEITPAGDPASKTFRVKIGLPEDTPLMIGMSVEANIIVREKENALLVPGEAVSAGKVWVIEGALAMPRPIKTGIRGTRMVEILDGLKDGDRIATPAPVALVAGGRINEIPAAK